MPALRIRALKKKKIIINHKRGFQLNCPQWGTKGDNLAVSWIIHAAISLHLHFSSSFKCQALTHLAFLCADVLKWGNSAVKFVLWLGSWKRKRKKILLRVSFHWSSSLCYRICSTWLKRTRIFVRKDKSGDPEGPGRLGSHLCTKESWAINFEG